MAAVDGAEVLLGAVDSAAPPVSVEGPAALSFKFFKIFIYIPSSCAPGGGGSRGHDMAT